MTPRAIGLSAALLLLVLALPGAANAATATANVEPQGKRGTGPVRFVAGRGETNRLTISVSRGVVFRDRANPVRARGDCRQIDRHAARCPITESRTRVRLRGGDDRAVFRPFQVYGQGFIYVFGGTGNDRLRGNARRNFLFGRRGDDRLRGATGDDVLNGGPGRDRVRGGRMDDRLIDGETDARAAPDVYAGGPSTVIGGDTLDYRRRRRALRIDLGAHRTSTEDRLRGLEGLVGGRGDDRLTGDDDENELVGRRGADVLRGGPDSDNLDGGAGEDRLLGQQGRDTVTGDAGPDALSGGSGSDLVRAKEPGGAEVADDVDCGAGDDFVDPDRADTLDAGCETVDFGFSFSVPRLATVPALSADSADFLLTCALPGGLRCTGTLSLSGPDGMDFGQVEYSLGDVEPHRTSVPLTPAAQEALRAGVLVTVELASEPFVTPQGDTLGKAKSGGYRVFLRR